VEDGTVLATTLRDDSGKLLILRDGELLLSENGDSWQAVRPGFEPAMVISTFVAPVGLDLAKPLLVGLANGEIIKR
jgi:hypothetical protein